MPHHAKSYYHMGEVLKSMDDIDGCIEAYKTAITFGIDPLWTAQVSRQLSRIYEEHKGDTDHAFACMQLAQELHFQVQTIEPKFRAQLIHLVQQTVLQYSSLALIASAMRTWPSITKALSVIRALRRPRRRRSR